MAYENAYFQFAQRNTQNFEHIVAQFLEEEATKGLAYGCKPECINKCMSNLNEYQHCMQENLDHYPKW